MKTTHLFLRELDRLETPRLSYVMWSTEPATKVIFFVHGFRGSALSTWRQFDSLAPECPAFERADLVFLGYDSVWQQTNISAGELLASCNKLIRHPADFMNPTLYQPILRRSKTHRYQNVWFVAHSLGAIVTRQILLVAQEKEYPWVNNARMVLFAPAHKGATDVRKLPSALVSALGPLSGITILSPLSGLIGVGIAWKAQTLAELDEKSDTLMDLQTRTKDALASRRSATLSLRHLIASRVIFGSKEDVVRTTRFCEDPPMDDPIRDKRHQDVCKPTPAFREPLNLVGDGMSVP